MLKRKKTSKGKQKIELRKIADKNALFISFSKRKNGVFTKASDLSTLCGTDVVVVIFSPTGRAFSFGCPTVEPIMERFLSGSLFPSFGSQEEQIHRRRSIHEKNRQVMELSRQVDAARAMNAKAKAELKVACQELEWLYEWDKVTLQQLDKLEESLEVLKSRVQNRLQKLQPSVRASPSNEVVIVDHAGASGAGGLVMGDPRWQGFEAVLNMGLLPITDYHMDPTASSSNAFTVFGLPGSSGSAGFGPIDPGWSGIQAILNPVLSANSARMVNPYEPLIHQPNPTEKTMDDYKNINYMYPHF
ncbi:hypothetical protein BHE74_00024949 [Ensete ventricosum]|nr:hypothetical protein GW17_00029155 [Ensete ventricosum]RWW67594.1 hypothetical protein BHE74_00024949 [Ensete ventricosum]